MNSSRPLRVAVIGSGPAGIYASDLLMKSGRTVEIDLFEQMPAPFGLIRYGVAPDHPRIKGIIASLHRVLDTPTIRLLGNIHIGEDITIAQLHEYYDAVLLATGAVADRDLGIPGENLNGSYGAADFVGFYDGNPRFHRTWNLTATHVAIIGVDNVYQTLKTNQATHIHIFGRRGPAQAKFTPLELKELDHSRTIEVIVNPEDIDYDEASINARRASKSQDLVCQTLEQYAMRDPKGAPHKLTIHFLESPVEILGEDGNVVGLRTERMELDGTGNVTGTGKFTEWPVQAVYRAVGYRSDPVPDVPFDQTKAVIPNDGGHVLDDSGNPIPGLYATGWIKRGPVGLIGNTKSDAKETTDMLIADALAGRLTPRTATGDITEYLEAQGIPYTTWDGWHKLDAHERSLGSAEGRERKKVVEWDEMVAYSRS